MSNIGRRDTVGAHDLWRVSQAATFLTGQAWTLSARHINDGALRLQFNREVAYYARGIVRDVESGGKSVDEGLKAIKQEQDSLVSQSIELGKKSVGLVAGGLQVASGAAICYASVGTLCVLFGVPVMAHGANNIYENGRNLIEGRSDTVGPTRKGYQKLSMLVGGTEREGNMAYGSMDLALSVYGISRHILRPDSWRLFRHIRSDYVRGYQSTSLKVFTIERASDALTSENLYNEWKDHSHE
ncbi:DUF4225 domain-containing protein [Pseudomonas syringae]|uniref:DUF4225 domain-containing protein n=1 Tax=Pseudomonas syringae TaxID=317 RepID=UPI003F76F4E9